MQQAAAGRANKSWQQRFNPDIDILSMDGQKAETSRNVDTTVKFPVLIPNVFAVSVRSSEDPYSIIWNFEHFSSSKHQYESGECSSQARPNYSRFQEMLISQFSSDYILTSLSKL